jgi:hypothetical protein
MKPRIISASRRPARSMNSWKGSTTASRKVFGAPPATSGSRASSASSHARQHEQRGDDEDLQPGQAVGQDQRQRTRHQPGNAVGIDMHRVAQAQLGLGQDLAAVGIERDVLRRREQGHRSRQPEDGHDPGIRREQPKCRDRQQQADLGDQHPAAPPAQRRRIAVEQRRPEELPGVGKLDQREQPDGLEIHALRAQPGRHQVEQQVKRQPRREAGEHADQHAPVKEWLQPRGPHQKRRVMGHQGLFSGLAMRHLFDLSNGSVVEQSSMHYS